MLQAIRRRWLTPVSPLLALLALAVISAACGGNDNDGDARGDGASTQQAAAPTLESPAALASYRYDMTIDFSGSAGGALEGVPGGLSLDLKFSMELSGAVIAPDREQSKMIADLGFLTLEVETIRIGDRVWTRESGGDWEVQTTAEAGLLDFGFDLSPTDFFGDDVIGAELDAMRAVFADLRGTQERVNGVEAVRYDLSAKEFAQAFPDGDGAPPDGTTSIWIARDSGVPVRLVLEATIEDEDGAGGESQMWLELNLTDLNADDIVIEPPA